MIKLGVVMDPIGSISVKKDTTYAILLAAQNRGWPIYYAEQGDLYLDDGVPYARIRHLTLFRDTQKWFEFGDEDTIALDQLDVLLMRKDPPFDMEYVHTTYLLEQVEARGVFVVNRPQALRDANEKMFTAWFPQCTPPTVVTRRYQDLRAFLDKHNDIILKPLGSMGGESVFRVASKDPNINVIMETLTDYQRRFIMAQQYLPDIKLGDKRVLLIDGEPVPYALARMAPPGETRANLAVGGHGEGKALSTRDRWICEQVGPTLRERGIMFAGLDIIGDYLTEINVTSPTCIRELDTIYELDIGGQLLDAIEAKLRIDHKMIR